MFRGNCRWRPGRATCAQQLVARSGPSRGPRLQLAEGFVELVRRLRALAIAAMWAAPACETVGNCLERGQERSQLRLCTSFLVMPLYAAEGFSVALRSN